MGGKLDLVLEHLDVESRHIPKAQPEYNGVIERLMRTSQEEGVRGHEVETEQAYRDRMAAFQSLYNERPPSLLGRVTLLRASHLCSATGPRSVHWHGDLSYPT